MMSSDSAEDRAHLSSILEFLKDYSDVILYIISPVVWILVFIAVMDRESLIRTWYMPILGLLAAFLANSIPIGMILLRPALDRLGLDNKYLLHPQEVASYTSQLLA